MSADEKGVVLSDVEIILPNEVIETCRTLKPDSLSCFMSVNEEKQTTSQLMLHKLDDNSVRIRVTVMLLGSHDQRPISDDCSRTKDVKARSDEVSLNAHGIVTEKAEAIPENGHEKMHVKRRLKPCIANPIDTNRLNKKLTSIWGSKRKKVLKRLGIQSASILRSQPSAGTRVLSADTKLPSAGAKIVMSSSSLKTSTVWSGAEATAIEASTVFTDVESANVESVVASAASIIINAKSLGSRSNADSMKNQVDKDFDLMPGSSTVIILKTASPSKMSSEETGTGDEFRPRAEVATGNDEPSPEPRPHPQKNQQSEESNTLNSRQSTSRDIAERLKARARKGLHQVSCELCGELVDGYSFLYRHIKKQHNDCTFVRNYLEEIEPLACTLCSVCKKPFTTPMSLSAHIASAHPEKQKVPALQLSKLSAQRHHIAAEKRRPPTPLDDTSDDNDDSEENGPFICKVCGKQCEDIVKYRRHSLTHGEFRFPCEHCDKRFRLKDNLLKHLRRVHTKTIESKHQGSGFKPSTSSLHGKCQSTAKGSVFRCDHCRAVFNRTSLLVTHMRYCLKQKR